MPVAWATGAVQADSFCATKAGKLIEGIDSQLQSLIALPFVDAKVRTDMTALVADVRASIKNRAGFFSNEATRLLEKLHPGGNDNFDFEALRDEIVQYFLDREAVPPNATETLAGSVAKELANFKLRRTDERKQSWNAFWQSRELSSPYVAAFARDIAALLLTEAAVERSFALEDQIFTGLRSKGDGGAGAQAALARSPNLQPTVTVGRLCFAAEHCQ
jgi:hypothetical protein